MIFLLVLIQNQQSKGNLGSTDSLDRALQEAGADIASLDSKSMTDIINTKHRDSICAAPDVKGTPITTLLRDPYILCAAGALTIANFPLAFIEPMIGRYMKEKFNSTEEMVGMVWLPSWFPHLLGVAVTIFLAEKFRQFQWFYGALGMLIVGLAGPLMAAGKGELGMILPLCAMCFGVAVIDTALLPTIFWGKVIEFFLRNSKFFSEFLLYGVYRRRSVYECLWKHLRNC